MRGGAGRIEKIEGYPRIGLGDTPARTEIDAVYTGFIERALPKACWTHAAHLVVALTHLARAGLEAARRDMPGLIRRYNEATNTPNTDTEGYHETLTQFYLGALEAFRQSRERGDEAADIAALLASPLADRAYPLRAYSRERLFSVRARLEWVEPDLQRTPPA